MVPLLIGISLITFLVVHLAPGKPSQVMMSLNPHISLETIKKLEKLYGLDKPFIHSVLGVVEKNVQTKLW